MNIVFCSQDAKLIPILMCALKPAFSTTHETDIRRLQQAAASGSADVFVLDYDANSSSFDRLLTFLGEFSDSMVPVVVMTSDQRRSTTAKILRQGAYDCIGRPPSVPELSAVLQRAFERASSDRELKCVCRVEETFHCDTLVGTSSGSQAVYKLIRRVANLATTILITGESGTGKELVAHAIHNLGNRSQHPFIPVSCSAIPESLIEAELFGHEKGAYTGTNGSRAGYLEQAGEGTLFLDEIGELSPHTQVKLLRVLQHEEFCRLGSTQPIPLKARILLATHRDLEKMVQHGAFRTDLYFRVNVMQIQVPPLRDRPDDIPALVSHFLNKYSQEYQKQVNDVDPAAMELLQAYDWPGNVRELENVIQGAIILTDDDCIAGKDLPAHLHLDEFPKVGESETFNELLSQFKFSLANRAVEECQGNKTLAARKLGISRAYLHRLLIKPQPRAMGGAA